MAPALPKPFRPDDRCDFRLSLSGLFPTYVLNFAYLPVIVRRPLTLLLNIRELCIDRSGKSFFHQRLYFLCIKLLDRSSRLLHLRTFCIRSFFLCKRAPVSCRNTLRTRRAPEAFSSRDIDRSAVYMIAVNIALAAVEPARSAVDESRYDPSLQSVISCICLKLSPSLIEDRPVAYRRMIVQVLDRALP